MHMSITPPAGRPVKSRPTTRTPLRPCAPAPAAAPLAPGRRPTALAAIAAPPKPQTKVAKDGHSQMLHGLGAVGDVPAKLMPFLLRLAHVR